MRFLSASVQNHQAALTLSRKKEIKSLAEVFKSKGDAILARFERSLFYRTSEATYRMVAVANEFQDAFHHVAGFVLVKTLPRRFAASKNC